MSGAKIFQHFTFHVKSLGQVNHVRLYQKDFKISIITNAQKLNLNIMCYVAKMQYTQHFFRPELDFFKQKPNCLTTDVQ